MKVLVTAGDTYEPIDDVRKVTHMATGRLGSLIADEFARHGAEVTLVCGEGSLRPTLPMAKVVEIQGVISLQEALTGLLSETSFDCVVHSMAVSDYTVRGLATEEDLIDALCKIAPHLHTSENDRERASKIKQAINNALLQTAGKISSDYPAIAVFMDRAPKVISCVKQIQPKTILVGFKLLSNVEEEELLQAAREQMAACGSDLVLANDLARIKGDKHQGILIGPEGILARPATKPEIAQAIVAQVTNRIKGPN